MTNSSLSQSQKHRIILHRKDILTSLFAQSKHLSHLHSGPTLFFSILGSTHHIIGARRLVRTICHSCVTCRCATARTKQQMMDQLPPQRVTRSTVFTKTCIDFAGLFIEGTHTETSSRESILCMCLHMLHHQGSPSRSCIGPYQCLLSLSQAVHCWTRPASGNILRQQIEFQLKPITTSKISTSSCHSSKCNVQCHICSSPRGSAGTSFQRFVEGSS